MQYKHILQQMKNINGELQFLLKSLQKNYTEGNYDRMLLLQRKYNNLSKKLKESKEKEEGQEKNKKSAYQQMDDLIKELDKLEQKVIQIEKDSDKLGEEIQQIKDGTHPGLSKNNE